MKVIVKKEIFSSILGRLSKFAGDGKVLPIYANFLIKVTDKMEITCGDGVTYVYDILNLLSVEEPGEFAVGAKELTRLVDSLSSTNDITLELLDNKLSIRSGRSQFKLNTMSVHEYPDLGMDLRKGTEDISIPTATLQAAFKNARVCVAKDMTNPYLTGYKVDKELFTSDALKIFIFNEDLGNLNLLLSQTCVDAILYASKDEANMKLSRQGNEVFLYTDGYAILSTIVDGIDKFPSTEPFLNQTMEVKLKMDRRELIPILERACIFTLADLSNAVTLTVRNGEIEVKSFADVDTSGSSEVVAVQYSGDPFTVLLDGKDLADILKSLNEDSLLMFLESGCANIKIEQDKLIYILCTLDFNVKG